MLSKFVEFDAFGRTILINPDHVCLVQQQGVTMTVLHFSPMTADALNNIQVRHSFAEVAEKLRGESPS